MKICFDAAHLYYLPQYQSVAKVLAGRGVSCRFVVYRNPVMGDLVDRKAEELPYPYDLVSSDRQALDIYRREGPDWVVFGNGFALLNKMPNGTRTALINHGAGIKSVGYHAGMNAMDIRFVDGTHHFRELKKAFPDKRQVLVGFSKLDPIINGTQVPLDLAGLGLDPEKPTLLYAPTFFPSSIERFPDTFPKDFQAFNLLVKFHFFSYVKSRYRAQRKKLASWRRYGNVHAAGPDDVSILPYLATADLLISDASSTLFEFAALNRPVVWCDFVKLRWTYRGPFRFRYQKRLDPKLFAYRDIAAHAGRYRDLKGVVTDQLARPETFEKKRLEYTDQLLGPLDGQASFRVADYLMDTGLKDMEA